MAEFCLDCFNTIHGTHYTEKRVTLQQNFCENCAAWKPCIVTLKPESAVRKILKAVQKHK